MSIGTSPLTFAFASSSDPTSPLVAAMVSSRGLIPIFGITGNNGNSEVERGIMTVPDLTDWFTRLNKSSFKNSGPTGSWQNEWWAVHNYLLYGGSCLIGGTGSTGDYYSPTGGLTATDTPLHNKSYASFDVVFDSGNTFSAVAAASVATTRKDCIGIVGNYTKITGLPLGSSYTNHFADFGVTSDSEYVMFVAGRKKYTAGVGNAVTIKDSNISPDVAGCFARTVRDNNIWITPAGKTRGGIKSVLSLEQNFSDSDSNYLIEGNVNPVKVFPGEGTYLMGNETSYTGSEQYLNKVNVAALVIYLKKQILPIAESFLFELNNPFVRSKLISSVTPLLERVKSAGGIQNYRVVCDATNNTSDIIAQNKLIADIYVSPILSTEVITINIINTTTSQVFSS